MLEFKTADGVPIRLCDYGSLGQTGCRFSTWFDLIPKRSGNTQLPSNTPFQKINPSRTFFLESLRDRSLRVKISTTRTNEIRRFRFGVAVTYAQFIHMVREILHEGFHLEYEQRGASGCEWRALDGDSSWERALESSEELLRVRVV
eukprot:SAG31_NODE_2728_length_5180_cov_2.415469_1_plen_146_part_00